MDFIMVFLFAVSFIVFLLNAGNNFDKYIQKRRNNNYVAIGHRNKAVLYSILCIIFLIAFACNHREFHLSNNQLINNCLMSRETNDDSSPAMVCSWAGCEHGSTVARVKKDYAGILPISVMLLFSKQCTRVKAVRFEIEKNKQKTFITHTYAIKALPSVEQYLS